MTALDLVALTAAALALLSMPVFAIAGRRRARDPEVARRGQTVLIGYWLRDWLMWAIAPFERALVGAGVSPLVFNLGGVLCGAAAGMSYALGALSFGGWFVLLGGVCDVLDGRIARARRLVSEHGAFLDSTLDRFAETFAFLGIAWYFAGRPWAEVAVSAALGGSLLVSYTRACGEAHGVSMSGGVMQRAERLALLALASLLDGAMTSRLHWRAGTLLAWTAAVIGAGSIGTAAYRTIVIARALDAGRPRE